MALEFAGKNVLLVDDSIVRGTTSEEIIQMAKDVGAKKVIVTSYTVTPANRLEQMTDENLGTQTSIVSIRLHLVAYGRNTEEIAEAIGADLVVFQTLPDLIASVRQFNPSISTFDCSVFTGEYVTGGVSEEYSHRLESLRADNVKNKVAVNSWEGQSEGGRVDGFHTRLNPHLVARTQLDCTTPGILVDNYLVPFSFVNSE